MEEKDSKTMISVKHLSKKFGEVTVLKDINLDIKEKEVVVIIGPSGSGKSTILRCLNHLETPSGGEIVIDGIKLEEGANLNAIRREVGMVFQRFNLFPNMTVLQNIMLAPMQVRGKSKEEAKEKAMRLLKRVGLEHKADAMPDELSGGMRQRVMIAMGLICHPKLLIADEPTTALDVTIQAQILELMKELQKKTHMGIIFITHNLGVVAEICDKVSVMYAGKIVEQGPVDDIFYKPGHPYTVGLLRSMPRVDAESYERLIPIEGTPVDMLNPPEGCPFAPRCEHAMKICLQKMPPYVELGEGHRSACWLRVQDQLDKAGQEKPVQDQEVSGRE